MDDGDLDRTLVEDLVELARPMGERYEIAYVQFLDTFLDRRLGHWRTIGAPAGCCSQAPMVLLAVSAVF